MLEFSSGNYRVSAVQFFENWPAPGSVDTRLS